MKKIDGTQTGTGEGKGSEGKAGLCWAGQGRVGQRRRGTNSIIAPKNALMLFC